jgi:hypothetical protein
MRNETRERQRVGRGDARRPVHRFTHVQTRAAQRPRVAASRSSTATRRAHESARGRWQSMRTYVRRAARSRRPLCVLGVFAQTFSKLWF